ncbi:hypothetical protein KIW84_036148 [Lathyrus oleraceus]|uniref:Uncharacterized protein n=1 Tax=Pisum sativum TaxID=3888 RepID=A0A9D5B6N0_PEA|nr:hypothetical protein KIW84_036148 [Pisum sativum]
MESRKCKNLVGEKVLRQVERRLRRERRRRDPMRDQLDINEKLTTTQCAYIECTPFKWAMYISNNFSISGGLLWELVSRWDIRSRVFRGRDRIVPFTPVDVSFALGFSIVGNKVFTGFIKQLDNLSSFDTHSWGLDVYNFVVSSLRESSVVLKEGKKQDTKTFKQIIDRMVAIEEELKYDIVNVSLFEQGQRFMDVNDYQILVAENKDFKERIVVLEDEMRMMKEARVKTLFEDEVVQDDRQLMNFITEDEV